MELETFFGDEKHRIESKTIVASVVPNITNRLAFDHLYAVLRRNDSWDDPCCLTQEVAKQVSVSYVDLYSTYLQERGLDSYVRPIVLRRLLSDRLKDKSVVSEKNKDKIKSWRDERLPMIQLREYQIDTATAYLLEFWNDHNKNAPQRKGDEVNLRGLILRNDDGSEIKLPDFDFSRADFSSAYLFRVNFNSNPLKGANLTNADLGLAKLASVDLEEAVIRDANFDCANVSGADLGGIKTFENSSWNGVAWWEAKQISSELRFYLESNWSRQKSETNIALGKCKGLSKLDQDLIAEQITILPAPQPAHTSQPQTAEPPPPTTHASTSATSRPSPP